MRSTNQTQQEALYKELPQQPRAARAQRRAHSNLTPATLGAGQQQAGHVDRGQQPHCEHQAIQCQQARTYIARQRSSVVLDKDASCRAPSLDSCAGSAA